MSTTTPAITSISLSDFRADPIGTLKGFAAYGDVASFRMARRSFVLLNDPALIGRVLTAPAEQFGRGPGLLRTKALLGDGLLTNDTPAHRERRRSLLPAFTRERVEGYRPEMAAEAETVIAGWRDGDVVDIHREMTRLTLGIVARTLFQYDGVDAEVAATIGDAVTDALQALYDRLAAQLGQAQVTAERRGLLRKASSVLDDAIGRIVADYRENGREEGLLSLLIGSKSGGDQALRDEAMTFFLAGHESVSNALSWTCHLLAAHPDIQEKAAGGALDPDNPYIREVIRESLRLYPPAWMLSRCAREPVRFDGMSFPAETIVVTAQCVTHLDARYFPSPETFDPDRRLGNQGHPKYAYFPFGAGHRACIGERFALSEMAILLDGILGRWRLHPVAGYQVDPLPAVTLRPRNGVRVRLERR